MLELQVLEQECSAFSDLYVILNLDYQQFKQQVIFCQFDLPSIRDYYRHHLLKYRSPTLRLKLAVYDEEPMAETLLQAIESGIHLAPLDRDKLQPEKYVWADDNFKGFLHSCLKNYRSVKEAAESNEELLQILPEDWAARLSMSSKVLAALFLKPTAICESLEDWADATGGQAQV